MQKEERFSLLLGLYLRGTISASDHDEFFNLIASHQFDHLMEEQIEKDLHKGLDTTEPGLPPHISQEIMRNILSAEKIAAEIIPARKNYRIWYRAAAAAAIVALAFSSWILFFRRQTDEKIFASTIPANSVICNNRSNSVKVIVLDDSSRVELQPNSILHYPKKFTGTSREVYLEGSAFFEVTHIPTKPFLVYGNRILTKVLGTSFYVDTHTENGNEVVSVRSGRVQVSENNKVLHESNPGTSIIITPNQKAIYEPGRRLFETKLVAVPQPLLNQEDKDEKPLITPPHPFVYEHAKLGTIFQQLEDLYGIEIITENPGLNNCVFTGDVSGEDLFTQLKIICIATRTSYEVNGTKILITGQGCN